MFLLGSYLFDAVKAFRVAQWTFEHACRFVLFRLGGFELFHCRRPACEVEDLALDEFTQMERGRRFLGDEVKEIFERRLLVSHANVLVAMGEFGTNVVQRNRLIAVRGILQFDGERVQIEIFQAFGVLEDLLECGARLHFRRFLDVQCVDGHLACPIVRFGMDTRAVQDFDVRLALFHGFGVDLDEAGAVREHAFAHVVLDDEKGAILELKIVLFEVFDQVRGFACAESADELKNVTRVSEGDATIEIDTGLVRARDEAVFETLEELFAIDEILQRMETNEKNFLVVVEQLGEFEERILKATGL